MPRQARIVIANVAHHVTQRGNNRQDVFFTTNDRQIYLDLLRERCQAAGVSVLGYCLMTNHVHLIVVPPDADALARAIGRTHFAYTQHVNRLHGRSGHLWQGRFYSCPLDDVHQWRALAYIERNPVRTRLVRRAWRWPWSSAAAHTGSATVHTGSATVRSSAATRTSRVGQRTRSAGAKMSGMSPRTGGEDATGLLDLQAWRATWTPARWQQELLEPADAGWRLRFWRAARTGRPLAEDRWLTKLEAKLGRRLRASPVGRPRKAEPDRGTSKRRRKKGRNR